MTSKRILRYVGNHPFLFLASLVLAAIFFLGGMLIILGSGSEPPAAAITVAPTVTDTSPVVIQAPTGTPPPTELVTPTTTITSTPEETVTNQPEAPSPTVEETATYSENPLVIHFIDVGQGDAILVESPDGQASLIDGGSKDSEVVAYLWEEGVEQIDLMVATHPHEDHVGGLTQVLEAFPVTRVVTNGQMHTTSTYEHFLDAILNSGAEYSEVQRGDVIELGDLEFYVLNPGGTLVGDDLNENSVVLRLEYGSTTFLFMGDAGNEAEAGMLAAGVSLKADILKVGHHGSCSATSLPFLQVVRPEVGIYFAGIDNQYGHPCAETVSRLGQEGVWVLGTDVNGSLVVTVTMDGYHITNADGQEITR